MGDAKNYRPVASTSHIIKKFDTIIVKKLTAFLETNQLMNPNQHAFRAHRSCLSQLPSHYELIINALESKCYAYVIFLDFVKAFDKVNHGILLKKMNVSGNLAVWIHNFISDRKQRVSVDGTLSDESPVISGVPQGSVLGPILFLILISDINKDIHLSSI